MYSKFVREGKHLHEVAAPLNIEENQQTEPSQDNTIERMQHKDEVRAAKLLHSALQRQLRIKSS